MQNESDALTADRVFFTALINTDSEALEQLLTDDFILVDVMAGNEIAKPALLAAVASRQVQFDDIVPAENRVRVYDTAAVVTGRTRMTGRLGETPFAVSSRYTHVFVRRRDRWLLASAQGTQIKEG